MGICCLLLSFPQFGDFTLMHEYGSFGMPGRHNEFTILPCITQALICNFLRKYVDFSAHIPNCIALYLLLTAHREPADKRVQKLDVGDNADKTPLSTAITRLQILDPDWKCQIVWPI